jgi:hypothetical protein
MRCAGAFSSHLALVPRPSLAPARADQPGQYQGQTDRDERDHSGDGNGVRPRRMAAGSRAGDMGRNFAKVVRAKSIPPGPHVRECASLQDAPSISYDRAVPRVAATGLVAMEPNGATSGYGDEQACDQDSTSHLRGEPTVALGLGPRPLTDDYSLARSEDIQASGAKRNSLQP